MNVWVFMQFITCSWYLVSIRRRRRKKNAGGVLSPAERLQFSFPLKLTNKNLHLPLGSTWLKLLAELNSLISSSHQYWQRQKITNLTESHWNSCGCVWTVTFLTTAAANDTMTHAVLKKATFLIRLVGFSALLSLRNCSLFFFFFLQQYSPWHPAAALSIISYNRATTTPYTTHLVSFGLVSHCNWPHCHLL